MPAGLKVTSVTIQAGYLWVIDVEPAPEDLVIRLPR